MGCITAGITLAMELAGFTVVECLEGHIRSHCIGRAESNELTYARRHMQNNKRTLLSHANNHMLIVICNRHMLIVTCKLSHAVWLLPNFLKF